MRSDERKCNVAGLRTLSWPERSIRERQESAFRIRAEEALKVLGVVSLESHDRAPSWSRITGMRSWYGRTSPLGSQVRAAQERRTPPSGVRHSSQIPGSPNAGRSVTENGRSSLPPFSPIHS
ncbi:hypothetical protein CCAX7_62110 [Capsulimonas corticalis]|uniref:Uncharacterized protein n=1 Tax=Capsulimonas corticalis TaxID=2219043 RepID=A0A402CWH9_9BACT|nr:hypothetical protein CCAX7_62110 [Capsulimonas corticalis]